MKQIKPTIARLSHNLDIFNDIEKSFLVTLAEQFDTQIITTEILEDQKDALKRALNENTEYKEFKELESEMSVIEFIQIKMKDVSILVDIPNTNQDHQIFLHND